MTLKQKPAGSAVHKQILPPKAGKPESLETVEGRLDAKAAAADAKRFSGRGLGEMSPEERRKKLFG